MSNVVREKLSYYKYLFLYELGRKRYPIRVHSTAETLGTIHEKRCAISRFGDGEFDLIYGNGLKFQKYDPRLAEKMKTILRQASEQDTCKVAVPYALHSFAGLTCNSKKFWSYYSFENRERIHRLLDPSYTYYDAQITRIYVNRKNKMDSQAYFQQWKMIWSGEDVLVVEGISSRFGAGNDLFADAKSVQRIICPAQNAFDYYDQILTAVTEHGKNKLVLLVLGPTATVLAYDLSRCGIWAVDAGNLDMEYEWSKVHATRQMPVFGKYTHEAEHGTDVSVVVDQRYEEQIVARIGVKTDGE